MPRDLLAKNEPRDLFAPAAESGGLLKAAGAGLRSGLESTVGGFADVADLNARGASWLLEKAGVSPEMASTIGGATKYLSPGGTLPTTEQVQQGATNPVIGEGYQPQNSAEKFVKTGMEFLPGAVGGEGNIIRKLLTQVAAPAMASEGAGQLAEKYLPEKLAPYARIIGALLGAGGANMAPGGKTVAKTPTAKDIFREGGNAYEDAKPVLKGTTLTNEAYGSIIDALKAKGEDFGMIPEAHGPVMSFLDRAQKEAAAAAEPSLYDIELKRRGLGHIGGSNVTNKSQGALTGQLTDTLDQSVDALDASAFKTGDATEADKALETLSHARATWKTGIKAGMIEKAMGDAQNAASGLENGLRSEFRKLLKDSKAKNFTDTELAAIKKVANGTFTQNAMRWLGGFGVPTDNGRNFLGSVTGMLAGNALGGPIGAVGLPALGTAAKAGASHVAGANAAIVDALVKAGPKGAEMYQKSIGQQGDARIKAIARMLMPATLAQ